MNDARQPAGPRVDLVVPVHGGWSHVEDCLASLIHQTIPCRVIVVDDLSPDDTLDRIHGRFPEVDVIANPVNVGFATSCNVGIRAGHAEFVVLVNSDVIAVPTMAESIVATFDADTARTAGSVSSILLDSTGAVDSFGITADRTAAGFVRFHGALPPLGDAGRPALLGPYGAVAAYRRSALDEVGLFDENIFMYGEELDLALRLRSSGWDAAALEAVVGTHAGGASAGRGSARQRYLHGFSRGYLLRRYGVVRGRHAASAVVVEVAASLFGSLQARDLAAVKGRISGWRAARGLPRRSIPMTAIDPSIDFRTALSMRNPGYWRRRQTSEPARRKDTT